MSLDPPTADRELRAVAALGREFRRLDLMPERPRRFAVPRRRRIAMFAVLMALLSVGSVGAATGLIPVGTEHESLVLDSGDTVHTVVATGSSPVAGHWRVESYRGGALRGPTGKVLQPSGARCLALLIGGQAPDFARGSSVCGGKLATDAFGYASHPVHEEKSGRNELLLYGWAPAGTETVRLSASGGVKLSARTQGPETIKQRHWVIAAPPLTRGGSLTPIDSDGKSGPSIKVTEAPHTGGRSEP
jgi:hypothetical protein